MMQTTLPDVLTTLFTLRDYIRWAASRFTQARISFGHGTVTALDEAAALVLHTVYQPYNLAEAYLDTRQSIDNLRVNPREGIDSWLDRTLTDFEATTGIQVERSILPLGQKFFLERSDRK